MNEDQQERKEINPQFYHTLHIPFPAVPGRKYFKTEESWNITDQPDLVDICSLLNPAAQA